MIGEGSRCGAEGVHLCPLYIASHEGRGLGCVDDMARPCRVARGVVSYHDALIALVAAGLALPDYELARLAPRGRA